MLWLHKEEFAAFSIGNGEPRKVLEKEHGTIKGEI